MANLNITSANVILVSPESIQVATAAVALTAGEAVILDLSTNPGQWRLPSASNMNDYNVTGICLDNAFPGQPGVAAISAGSLSFGPILTKGEVYVLSKNAGKICPAGDRLTGQYTCIVGVAISTSVMALVLNNSNTIYYTNESFVITCIGNPTSGEVFGFTVQAINQDGSTLKGYFGTVNFTGGGIGATLPSPTILTAGFWYIQCNSCPIG